MSAWADWVDARGQLVHQWRSEGASVEEIVSRLDVDAERVESWLRAPPLPFPGSSRAQLDEWKARVAALEAEAYAPGCAPPRPSDGSTEAVSVPSEMRSLRMHPDPECCGCQYWATTTSPGSPARHHVGCIHAVKP